MKYRLLFLFIFVTNAIFSQTEIYSFKDVTGTLSLQDVKKKEFSPLDGQILERHSDAAYWFKIPSYQTDQKFIVRFEYDRITNVEAYQYNKEIKPLPNERYISYQFSRYDDVYIKVNPQLHAYIPLHLDTEAKSILRDRKQMLINGFYYGFSFVIIIYSFFCFFVFKDKAFFYYSFLLLSVAFGLFLMDGMLNFWEFSTELNDALIIISFLFLAFFSGKFVNYYMFLDNYYPKHKILSYSVGSIAIVFAILYLIYKNYESLLILNILVFTILSTYWIYAVLLFKKNIYIKFLVFADLLILFSSIDFFILKFLGISMIHIDSMTLKAGCFLEMIMLSFAVFYRMKVLKGENERMKNEIIKFSTQLKNRNMTHNKMDLLSSREREIFNLIVDIKTNKEIASELNVSVNTVKFHIKNIYEKLEINSRTEVFSIAENVENEAIS